MDIQAIIAIGCLASAWALGAYLARKNLKELTRTRPERVAARRRFKRVKNMKLARFYGIDYRPDPIEDPDQDKKN